MTLNLTSSSLLVLLHLVAHLLLGMTFLENEMHLLGQAILMRLQWCSLVMGSLVAIVSAADA